jgi:predicted amino acid dehydrogenase
LGQAKHVGKVVVGGRATGGADVTRGTAVVTGGMGALGVLVAGWLARQGLRRLVLLGRGARAWGKEAARALLGLPHSPAYGALVTLCMADASTQVCL